MLNNELLVLRVDHEVAIYEFETENRAYFATFIGDRGDDYFADFAERHREMLAEQAAGSGAFFVLVDDDGSIVGRFNLYELADGSADVGYRVAQRVSGRGVASAALRNLCLLAHDQLGLRTLSAATSNENVASQRVLENAGFRVVGPTVVAGRNGLKFELDLASPTELA